MKIKRGFKRKVNLGNYESFDTWAEYEAEVPKGKDTQKFSKQLYSKAREAVEGDIRAFKGEREVLVINEQINALKEELEPLERNPEENKKKIKIKKFEIKLLEELLEHDLLKFFNKERSDKKSNK